MCDPFGDREIGLDSIIRRSSTSGYQCMTPSGSATACAHGNIIYDIRLSKSIIPGPAGNFIGSKRQRLAGLLGITKYMLKQISQDSADEMWKELGSCFMNLFIKQPKLKRIVEDTTKVNIADFS